ncbi:MAG: membrane-associated phospholipid phosphatase [Alteromonas naphthalenivorans]|jgi:membrane-associated phospholipid phosphatase
MKLGYVLLLFCIVLPIYAVDKKKKTEDTRKFTLKEKLKKGNPFDRLTPKRVNGYMRNVFQDTYSIGKNIFSLETMRLTTITLPFYLFGRHYDAKLHNNFYNINTHKNKNQPPKALSKIALDDKYISLPFVALGLIGFIHHNPYDRRRGQIFTNGLLWCFATKILLKQIKVEGGLRPWHENFDKHKRSHGGNPSGHMTITTYMAVFWGLEKGKAWGIPLGMFTAFALGMNVSSNHHYLSQGIAGMGLGAIVGVATHAAFRNITMPKNMNLGFATDDRGNLGVRFAYDF